MSKQLKICAMCKNLGIIIICQLNRIHYQLKNSSIVSDESFMENQKPAEVAHKSGLYCSKIDEEENTKEELLLPTRLKLKDFYSLNQSVLPHLLSKILAFMAFKGLKRPKKAEKFFFCQTT